MATKIRRTPEEARRVAAELFRKVEQEGLSPARAGRELGITSGNVCHYLQEARRRHAPLPSQVCDLHSEHRYRLEAVGICYEIPVPLQVNGLPAFRKAVLSKVRDAKTSLGLPTENIVDFSTITVRRLVLTQLTLLGELVNRIEQEITG